MMNKLEKWVKADNCEHIISRTLIAGLISGIAAHYTLEIIFNTIVWVIGY